MQQQHRQVAAMQNMAGKAAEDELAEPAVAIGAHDDKVCPTFTRCLENGVRDRPAA